MEPCGITRLCVRIVSVNVQESASLESVSNRSLSQRMWQSSKISTRMRSSQFIRLLRRQLSHSRSSASSDVAVVWFGVGGGLTGGKRSVRLALQAEHQGAYGVVVNAPIADESSRRSSGWLTFRSLRRLLRFTRMSAANWRREPIF